LGTVAFRVDGKGFLEFCESLDALKLKATSGGVLTRTNVVDHEVSWSVYFLDLDQNRIEVTTYDYDQVRKAVS